MRDRSPRALTTTIFGSPSSNEVFSWADSSPLDTVLQDTLIVFLRFSTDLTVISDLPANTELSPQESRLNNKIYGYLGNPCKVTPG
ncbi:MAG: hypothetical protein ACI9WC_000807 [Arenicella sp.]|jgi:hypothetical protein